MSGRLIVLEGLDGVGKSTLAGKLADALGARCLSTPDVELRSARATLDDLYRASPDATQLFYASSVIYACSVAEREIVLGRDVVMDRYWLSTWTYAVLRRTRLSLAEVEALLRPADWTFLISLDERIRQKRLRTRWTTVADRQTLDPRMATLLFNRYREGLKRPIAGHGRLLDATGMHPEDCIASILEEMKRRARDD